MSTLSTQMAIKPWQSMSLSASYWEGRTMVRTYDDVIHWIDLSGTSINSNAFARFGLTYDTTLSSGIKDVVFGRALPP